MTSKLVIMAYCKDNGMPQEEVGPKLKLHAEFASATAATTHIIATTKPSYRNIDKDVQHKEGGGDQVTVTQVAQQLALQRDENAWEDPSSNAVNTLSAVAPSFNAASRPTHSWLQESMRRVEIHLRS